MSRRRRILLTVLITLFFSLVSFVIIFVSWASSAAQPMPEALAALESSAGVEVAQQDGWWTFTPVGAAPQTGFIFYPGGRVDARAYAPLVHAVAEQGYLGVIVPMPLNLAILNVNGADAVIARFPEIAHWVIGGHSLGASMSAQYAGSHDAAIDGLAMLAGYPATNMSTADVAVVSIYGSEDGLARPAQVTGAAPNLPPDTAFVEITGGNHGQFGWYGDQSGDNPASISRDEQQAQTLAAILDLMARVSGSAGG